MAKGTGNFENHENCECNFAKESAVERSGSPNDFTATELKKMVRARNLCTVKRELIARLTTNDPKGSWIHGHGSNMNRVGANKDTDVSENSPGSSSEVNDSWIVNILLKKRAENRKYSKSDLVAIKRALHGSGLKFAAKYFYFAVRDIKSVAKRSLYCRRG